MKRIPRTYRNLALLKLATAIPRAPFSIVRGLAWLIVQAMEWIEDWILYLGDRCLETHEQTRARAHDRLRTLAGQWLTRETADWAGYPRQAGAWVCGCGGTWGTGASNCRNCGVNRPPLADRPVSPDRTPTVAG